MPLDMLPPAEIPAVPKNGKVRDFLQHAFRAYGKSITWRVIASTDTFMLSWYATHDPMRALGVMLGENVTKTFILYPFHEFLWGHVPLALDKTTGASSHFRSAAKAVTWRVIGSIDTLVLTYLFTGKIKTAAFVAGAELFTKIPLYYGHERVWKRMGHERLWNIITRKKNSLKPPTVG